MEKAKKEEKKLVIEAKIRGKERFYALKRLEVRGEGFGLIASKTGKFKGFRA